MTDGLLGYGRGKYHDISLDRLKHSFLGLIDVAEREGYRLTFESVVRLVRQGLTLEDFLRGDEETLSQFREPVKVVLENLIELYGVDEINELCSRRTFYHLIFLGMGVHESLPRLLASRGFEYMSFKDVDYETFKTLTGGRNRLNTYQKLMDSYRAFEVEMGASPETFESYVANATSVKNVVSEKIGKRELNVLEREFMGSCYDSLRKQFTVDELKDRLGVDERHISVILKRAEEKGLLKVDGHVVEKLRRTFEDLMAWEHLPEPELVSMRFQEGLGVQEMADRLNISKQRVSQKLKLILPFIPISHVKETKRYLRRFRRFSFTEEAFVAIFEEDAAIYRLLAAKVESGEEDVMDMYPRLTEEQQRNFERYFSVFPIDGRLVTLSKKSVLEKVMFERAYESPLHIDVITDHYRRYIEEHFSDETAFDLRADERSLMGIASRSGCAISSYGMKIRYHAPDVCTAERLERLYGLLNLGPGIYNTRYIYELDPELMQELDCQDAWELHNLIKNRINHPHVTMARMPELAINVEDKLAWLRHLISEHSPVALEEFLIYLSDNFGLHIPSMRSLIQTDLGEHLTPENTLVARAPSISTEEKAWLSSILVEDIYTFDQLLDMYPDTSDFYDKFLNKAVLSTVGYVIRGGFIVKGSFGSGEAYFRELIRSQDLYRIQNIPAARTQTYFKVLKDLETNLEIFRFDDDHYIGLGRLEKAGISKLDIETEVIKLVEHAKGQEAEYFTFPSLQKGFGSRLFDLGMENVFYERLIRLDDRINFIPTGGGDIFYFSNEKRTLGQFYLEHLPKNDGVDVHELMGRLEEHYLIPFNRSKLIESIRERGAFFSPETGKAYLTKEIFLDSIY